MEETFCSTAPECGTFSCIDCAGNNRQCQLVPLWWAPGYLY